MKNKVLYILVFFALTLTTLSAQKKYLQEVEIEGITVEKKGQNLLVNFDVVLDNLAIRSNDMLILTPVIKAEDNQTNIAVLAPIYITGRKRDIAIRRAISTGSIQKQQFDDARKIRRYNNKKQLYKYSTTLLYNSNMEQAKLVVMGDVEGCATCQSELGEKPMLSFNFAPYAPNYMLTYITPEVEPVKARADRHSASFNFVVDRHELRRDYKNNAREFERVDKVVSQVVKNKDITITEFSVVGYASPEGNFEYNRKLAERRAYAFADYLATKHNVTKNQFKVAGHGEDWEGLKSAIAGSSLSNKAQLLDIIATTSNPDARDAKIKALDNGATYKQLLSNFYPALRRTDYVIAYNVRAFDVEEAKKVIKESPKLLSLNEMYLVAQSYPTNSKAFKEVFDIAARLYPNDAVAIINAGAADIDSGNYQSAIERLSKLKDNPLATNNLAIAYARTDELDKAIELFEKAIRQGNEQAKHNLEEVKKRKESL